MNSSATQKEIQKFEGWLRTFHHRTVQAGRECYLLDGVQRLTARSANLYSARVQHREVELRVSIGQLPDGSWGGECNCFVGFDCLHVYAVALAISQERGYSLSVELDPLGNGEFRPTKGHTPGSLQAVTPALSPLAERMREVLGHPLRAEARRFLAAVGKLLKVVQRERRSLRHYDFQLLGCRLPDFDWQPLELWPKPPENDLELWLYCAWELRRRGLPLPEVMAPVTDFSPIETAMKTWERGRDVVAWKARLAGLGSEIPPEPTAEVDLRVVIHPEAVVVQWRPRPDEPFKDLKQAPARRLGEQLEAGEAALHPEAWPLWLAYMDPYGLRISPRMEYEAEQTQAFLNVILRQPSLASRVVTLQGEPLMRDGKPLRYAVSVSEQPFLDYQLSLVHADGTPVDDVLASLSGCPTLYLTGRAVFPGPRPHALEGDPCPTVPAEAMETAAGVRFLNQLGVELPARLSQRVRRVPVKVVVTCELSSPDDVQDREYVRLVVRAEQAGVPTEEFSSEGWMPVRGGRAGRSRKSNEGDFIEMPDRSSLGHFPRVLEPLSAKWLFQTGWRVNLTKAFPEQFVAWLAALPPGIDVLLDRDLATLRHQPVSGNVRLEVQESGVDWFDLKVVLNVSDTELTPDELRLLLQARGRYVRLGPKGWRRLEFQLTPEDDQQLASLGLDARDFSAEPQRLHALQLADRSAARLLPAQQAESIHRRAAELKTRVMPPPPAGLCAQLRPYQLEGFHFLAYLSANRFGGVLADDMGLGKTLQTLTWLGWLRAEAGGRDSARPVLPSLVVCPKSVMENWRSEARRFYPDMRVHCWSTAEPEPMGVVRERSDLVVLNYAQLRALSEEVVGFRWQAAILDEAQYIKNPDSQTAQVARALQAEHRLALTGTPIENRLLDLWSILSFAMPGVLGSRAQFTRRFSALDDPLARQRLGARVRPFLLRRTKGQVAKDLPDRVEEDIVCDLEGEQRTLYQAELKRARQLLLKVQTKQELNESRFSILTSLLRLRQICCHPGLANSNLMEAESAKVNALMDLVEPLMEEGHKVLIFSQFVTMLNLLQDTVSEKGWRHFYLAGDTEDRGELVQKFQTEPGAAVFLISLKAGGFGLNLTAASYVVLFDPWWNPAVENQAIDRTHRIGQVNKVIAYRLVMKGTVEEKIRNLQRSKAALADAVFAEEAFSQSLSLEDLRFLLADA